MNHLRAHGLLFYGSILVAFLLQLAPMPQALLAFKPYWPVLGAGGTGSGRPGVRVSARIMR